MSFVTRFAPSPTGYLHRGHAFSALLAYEAARAAHGRFLLRIEDIDLTRCRPEYERALIEDLKWLGLRWRTAVRRQSEHFPTYQAALDHLHNRGLLYRCFKTRRELAEDATRAPHFSPDAPPPYFGAPLSLNEQAERLAEGHPYAWRLSIDRARTCLGPLWDELSFVEQGAGPHGENGHILARPERLGDVVLARKDVGVAYHLAVVVDDALQGVNHVIRGHDLFEATHIQRLLYALLGYKPPKYRHHQLLKDENGQRLAKRLKSETLRDLRARGVTPDLLRAELRV